MQSLKLICINGHEPMTIVWDTTGIPHKKLESIGKYKNHAQMVTATKQLSTTVGLLKNLNNPILKYLCYLIAPKFVSI